MTNRRHDADRVLGHSYLQEVYQRPSIRRETIRDFWRSLAAFGLFIVALYALVIVAAGIKLSEAAR